MSLNPLGYDISFFDLTWFYLVIKISLELMLFLMLLLYSKPQHTHHGLKAIFI